MEKLEVVPLDDPDLVVSVYAHHGRLEITADVNLDGLPRLRAILAKYEELLNLEEE